VTETFAEESGWRVRIELPATDAERVFYRVKMAP
jgi:hypothetical protein